MKCLICRQGKTIPGETTITLDRGHTILVFRKVPAEVCENCGEAYVAEATTRSLLKNAEEAVAKGVEVDIRQFSAA